MSELRSALDGYRSEVLAGLPDARIEEDFAELQRAAELLEVERLRRLAEVDRRRLYERSGHLSAASWLAGVHRAGWLAATADVRAARALEDMPETRKALDEGDITVAAARMLVRARGTDPEAFREAEASLVAAARVHTVGDLRRITSYWAQRAACGPGATRDEKLREQRRLHASVTFLGMVRVDGDLDPESGETLLTALNSVMDVEAKSGGGEGRTPAQRRADALTEICRHWLDAGDRPTVGGERPHVTVTVGREALSGGQGASELDIAGPVGPEVARRLACDASIRRVVMAGRSEPLDVGRRTSVGSHRRCAGR